MISFIIFAVLMLATLGVGLYYTINFIKKPIPTTPFNQLWKILLIDIGVFAIFLTGMFASTYLWLNVTPKGYEIVLTIVGGIFFGLTGGISLFSFILHYYGHGKEGISEQADKIMFITLAVCFPLMFVFIFIMSDGIANYLTYPLVNAISFTKGFVNPIQGGGNLAFYALCILSGAIYVYLLCDHKFYIEYGKHGIIESTFLVAFPAGIIGARIFYVVGQFSTEFLPRIQAGEWWSIFAVWEGGLTILGGAIMGIVVGVAWFMWRNKGYNIWLAVDIIVPTILIAQAVGRWGNFFNCEVHGVLQPISYWNWLPTVIWKNMQYSSAEGWAPEGQMYVPLFLIEGIVNFLGYFVLAHLFGKKLRKYTQLGDLAFGYIVWYGLTRTFMEPLRDTAFNMGKDGYWSWIWSLVFVIGGALAIALNHLIRFLLSKKTVSKENKIDYLVGSICVSVLAIGCFVASAILLTNSSFEQALSLNKFNLGLIILAIGISILFGLIITLPPLIKRNKNA